MCRSIKRLRDGAVPATEQEIEEAARQFVRKISGFTKPARHNVEVFDRAVAEITAASQTLLDGLVIRGAVRRQ
jgi:hypothetical protein